MDAHKLPFLATCAQTFLPTFSNKSFHPSFLYGYFYARLHAALQEKGIYVETRGVNQKVFPILGNILILL